ncbi:MULTISPECIES: hypothetical protein [Serratia]|uniref:hypothetical protein n=1 Tax=Serratia TaxID=613 RepID=UPI00313C7730
MNVNQNAGRKLKKLIIFIFAVPVFFYSAMAQAVYVAGGYSDWRWEGPSTTATRWVEIDFNFSTILLDAYDLPFTREKSIRCSYGGCWFYIRIYSHASQGGNTIVNSAIFAPRDTLFLTPAEVNQRIRSVMPFKATVRFLYSVGASPCIHLYLATGGNDYKLGTSCDGVLPPLPPTTPKPPEPLSCSVTWQSSGEIDFGVMTPGENKAKGIAAKLACQGGTSGKARLRFTDVNQVGANTVTLRKSGSNDEIKVKLSIGEPNLPNEQIIDVSPGFNATYAFVAKLDGAQLAGVDGGDFSGNALIVFEVI